MGTTVDEISPIAMSVENAAKYVGISRSRIFNLIGDGEIRSFRIGGRRMLLRSELDSFVAQAVAKGANNAPV